ncbi:TfuA-like protein [uncultured Roseobacter sp.]|uniref:TfuA-like protein n=1 Tax=uncultured Roseobacter sp. TaxID=114847 RepID=UPI0026126BC2|nr:TfuA-like protein [uncultured Roseobacter sp.]
MIVFAGPSIAGLDLASIGDFDLRPPVQQGDVYLAMRDQPQAIGIVDGYFEGAPSVWHKEILWALTQGISVFGAASMGALRAAELHAFGMIGIGQIFEAYRDETLEDDDEVALLHGPEEMGYPQLSLAMVNVRATLDAAQSAQVITQDQAAWIAAHAKSQFYKTRTWDSVLATTASQEIPDALRQKLRGWIDQNEVDQKRIDAHALLMRMAKGDFDTPQPNYHFEETNLWLNATKTWSRPRAAIPEAGDEAYQLFGHCSFLDE